MRRLWSLWSVVFALAIGYAVVACSQERPEESGGGTSNGTGTKVTTVKLGAVLPLTGPNASFGQEASNAAKLAVKQWNEAGKIPGVRVEYIVEDDASDAKQAVAAARRLVEDPGVIAVVAHFNSGCLLPASPTYHRAGVMAVTPAATNPQITEQGFEEIARVCSHDKVQGMAAAMFMAKQGWKTVAVIHDRTQYGEGLAGVVQKNAASQGLTVQSFDGINVGDKDFKALLTKIKSQNPDVVYFGGLQEEASFLVRQMKDLGMKSQFVSDDGTYGQDFLNNAGPAAEGVIVSFPSTPLEELPNAAGFLEDYKKEYGVPVLNWGPYAYDTASLLLEAMRKALADPSDTPLRKKVVHYTRSEPFDGILGRLEFDEKGDQVNQKFSFYRVEGGKYKYLETISRKASP